MPFFLPVGAALRQVGIGPLGDELMRRHGADARQGACAPLYRIGPLRQPAICRLGPGKAPEGRREIARGVSPWKKPAIISTQPRRGGRAPAAPPGLDRALR